MGFVYSDMEDNNFVSLIWQERRIPQGVLTDQFVLKFHRYIDWSVLSRNYGLDMPIDIIRMFQHRLIWATLLTFRPFSEDILREMSVNFDNDCWQVVSKHQKLSEDFIHEYADKIDWELVVKYQNVSERFKNNHYTYIHNNYDNSETMINSGARRSV